MINLPESWHGGLLIVFSGASENSKSNEMTLYKEYIRQWRTINIWPFSVQYLKPLREKYIKLMTGKGALKCQHHVMSTTTHSLFCVFFSWLEQRTKWRWQQLQQQRQQPRRLVRGQPMLLSGSRMSRWRCFRPLRCGCKTSTVITA